jgi:ABC-type multidrug transport system permease subunit
LIPSILRVGIPENLKKRKNLFSSVLLLFFFFFFFVFSSLGFLLFGSFFSFLFLLSFLLLQFLSFLNLSLLLLLLFRMSRSSSSVVLFFFVSFSLFSFIDSEPLQCSNFVPVSSSSSRSCLSIMKEHLEDNYNVSQLCINYTNDHTCLDKLEEDCFYHSWCSGVDYDFFIEEEIRETVVLPVFSKTGLLLAKVEIHGSSPSPFYKLQVRWEEAHSLSSSKIKLASPGALVLTAFDSNGTKVLVPASSSVKIVSRLPFPNTESDLKYQGCLGVGEVYSTEYNNDQRWSCINEPTSSSYSSFDEEVLSELHSLYYFGDSLLPQEPASSSPLRITGLSVRVDLSSTFFSSERNQMIFLVVVICAMAVFVYVWTLYKRRKENNSPVLLNTV